MTDTAEISQEAARAMLRALEAVEQKLAGGQHWAAYMLACSAIDAARAAIAKAEGR